MRCPKLILLAAAMAIALSMAGRAAPPHTIAGRLLDADGSPAAGHVQLQVNPRVSGHGRFLRTIVDVRPDGSFRFEGIMPRGENEWAYVVGWREGAGGGVVELPGGASSEDLTVRLTRRGFVAGRVFDSTGKPITGADVWPSYVATSPQRGAPGWYGQEIPAFHARTDGTGAFRIEMIPAGGSASLVAVAPGYTRRFQETTSLEGSTTASFTLQRAATITGRVVSDERGTPVAHVEVHAEQQHEPGLHFYDGAWAETDAQGRYRLTPLAPGSYQVSLTGKGSEKGDRVARHQTVGPLKEGATAECADLQLTAGGLVRGRATNLITGDPVPEARVLADPEYETRTRADGTYTLRLPPGEWQLRASAPRGFARSGAVPTHRSASVASGGSALGVDFRLNPTCLVRGMILDPKGKPCPQARLSQSVNGAATDVGADGSFHVKDVPTGASMMLFAIDEARHLAGCAEVNAAPGQPKPILLRLRPMVRASGRIIDEKGEGIPAAPVICQLEPQFPRKGEPPVPPTISTTATDVEGQFQVWMLPGVSQQFWAGAPGHGCESRPHLMPDAGMDLGIIRLPRATLFVTGRVFDPDGKPLAHAGIHVVSRNQNVTPSPPSDEEGRFRIGPLVPGTLGLIVLHDEYEPVIVPKVTAGDSGVEIIFKRR